MFSVFCKLDKKYLAYLHSLDKGALGDFCHIINQDENWFPLYLVILFLIFKYEKKNSLHVIIFIGIILFVSNQITSGCLKPFLLKLNFYNIVDLNDLMQNVGSYVKKIGFVSAHAVKCFAVSTFLNCVLSRRCKKIPLLFIWPILVNLSQCVLRIHTINDVCSGAMIGCALGAIFYFLYKRRNTIVRKVLKNFVGTSLFK